jgi:hypothetical protein
MALLAIKVSKKVSINCQLEESTAIQVDKYAAFAKAPADDVVNSALEYVFSKDKDFLEYLEKNPELAAPETLRVKNPEESAAAGKRGPKTKTDAALV